MNIFEKLRSLVGSKTQAAITPAVSAPVQKTDTVDPFDFATFVNLYGANSNAYTYIPTVKLALDFITRNASQLEIGFFNFKDNEEIYKDTPSVKPLEALFNNPSPNKDQKAFIEAAIGYMIYRGECIVLMEKSWGQAAGLSKALPSMLRVVDPAQVAHYTNTEGDITRWNYKGRFYEVNDVIHVTIFNPDDSNRGLDVQRNIQDLLKTSLYTQRASAKFFENGARPDFILSTDQKMTQTQVNDIMTAWNASHKGVDYRHKTAILSDGLKPEQIAQDFSDAYINESKYTDERILSQMFAQKALLNMTDTTNYATFQGQLKVFWQTTILPLLLKLETALNQRVIIPYDENIELRFKYDNVPAFAEDYNEKLNQAEKLKNLGFPLNDINDRLDLGMQPVEWGNEWWINMGLMPASDYGKLFDTSSDNSSDVEEQSASDSKSLKAADAKSILVWKRFDITQARAEILLAQKAGGFLARQKSRIANTLKSGKTVDWKDEEQRLFTALTPSISAGVKEGIRLGSLQVPAKADNSEIIVARYLRKVATRISLINSTTQNEVNAAVLSGLAAGNTISEIVDTLDNTFSKTRARLIARTEATGSINGGTMDYFAEVGAKKTWLTTMDGNERASHAEINGETVGANERFSNGLLHPGDPSVNAAGEVCNCRCTLIGSI